MIRKKEKPSSKHHQSSLSSFRSPSKDANSSQSSYNNRKQHSNFGEICDETWPLDDVINKIELKTDSDDDDHDENQPYNVELNKWHSGPKIVSNTFDSGRDINRLPGNGTIISSWNHGSQTWKDKSVQHRKYRVKKNPSRTSSLEKSIPLSYGE